MRTKPFTGKFSSHPCRSCSFQVEGPSFATIWKGPTHICWNFVCFPFSSWGWSHLRTKSPTSNYFVLALFLSNHLFTTSYCCLERSLALDLDSPAFKRLCILICKTSLFDPLDSWVIMEEGSMILGGRMASFP